MLPAFFVGGTGVEAEVSLADIAAHENAEALAIATRARLPVAGRRMPRSSPSARPMRRASMSRC